MSDKTNVIQQEHEEFGAVDCPVCSGFTRLQTTADGGNDVTFRRVCRRCLGGADVWVETPEAAVERWNQWASERGAV
jgi:hypothetical protein